VPKSSFWTPATPALTSAERDPSPYCNCPPPIHTGAQTYDAFVDNLIQRPEQPRQTKGIVISRSPREVQIDGRPVEGLTELEFGALCHLISCSKARKIEARYAKCGTGCYWHKAR
jgi:hypothetical protein